MAKVVKFITILISSLMVVIAAAVAILAFPVFGNQALIVRSGSMVPSIPIGSIVVVNNVNDGKHEVFGKGEIVSFRRDANTIVTHRVVGLEIAEGHIYYLTKGDANEEADNWKVRAEDIIGKSIFILPEAGKILAFVKSKYGFPILIIFPALFVILLESVNIIKEVRKTGRRKELIHPLSFSDLQRVNYSTAFTKKNFGLVKAFIPIFACALFIQSTSAYFSDTETSSNNFFQAASSFGTPTPSPTLTVTPTVTPSPTPCSGCCGGNNNNVNVTGGGTGSSTTVIVDNECEENVNQNNSTTINTNVNQSSSTGGNSNNNNSSNTTTTTGSSTNSTTVTTTSSTNQSN